MTKHIFSIGQKVYQYKFKHDIGEIIELLPFRRYRVKWFNGNTNTYDEKYLRISE
jgi:hypothetical protein